MDRLTPRLLGTLALLAPAAAHADGIPMGDGAPIRAATLEPGEAITVDGHLDEPAWQRAAAVTDFVGIYPTEGFAPRGATSVRVLVDEGRVHFGFECAWDGTVRAHIAEREDVNLDDQIGIYLDPFGDARRMVVIYINALGIQQDALITLEDGWNGAYDVVFRSQGRIHDGGFTVEVSIPFRSLRFPKDSPRPWRALFTRKFAADDEKVAYPAVRQDRGHTLLQFVPLLGVEAQRSGVGVEVLPSVVVRGSQVRGEDGLRWQPFRFPGTIDPSVSVKWQPTSNLTLDGTFNPDFSQVEADPNFIDNNLRFALFLQEQRTFFLEGRELFDSSLLYTRSIVDPIAGLKFSGKAGPVSVGVLTAVDEAPAASLMGERDTPGFSQQDVDGAIAVASYVGGALDLGQRSRIALAVTDKELLGRERGEHRGEHRVVEAAGRVAFDPITQVDFEAAASTTARVGGERVGGPRLQIEASRAARLVQGGGGWEYRDPGYRSENGFVTRADLMRAWGYFRKRWEWAEGPVRWVNVGLDVSHSFEGWAVPDEVEHAGSSRSAFVNLRLPGITDAGGSVALWQSRFGGVEFTGPWGEVSLSNRALDWLRVSVDGELGESIRYRVAEKTLEAKVGGELWFRALRRLNVKLAADGSWLGRPGEELDRAFVWRARTLLGILPSMNARVIVQGRHVDRLDPDRQLLDRSDSLSLSVLLSWLPNPGTAVRLGFGEGWSWGAGRKPITDRRDLFLKASVLLRI